MAVPQSIVRLTKHEIEARQEKIREEESRKSELCKERLREALFQRRCVEVAKAVAMFIATAIAFVFLYWLANANLH